MLREGVEAFVELEGSEAGPRELYHRVLGAVHQLCASIVACEEAGLTREQIVPCSSRSGASTRAPRS